MVRMGWTRVAALVGALGIGALASPVGADEAEVLRRLEQLEQRQRDIQKEMDALRGELAKPKPPAEGERVGEVERRQGILTEEVRRLREALVLPETRELKSHYGLGPAASKVYGIERGLSIGGYGEYHFRSESRDETSDIADFLRFVTYFGYKYNDWIVLNTEVELEHAFAGQDTISAPSGEVELEFATLDFLLHPMANARTGLLLVPMGFLNEIHEPPFYHGNDRPVLERRMIPTTWRGLGAGLFGEVAPGLEYRTYGITSLNAKGFRSGGIAGGRQSGNRERAEDFSWVGRVDYTAIPGVLLGGSAYLGNQGQQQDFGTGEATDAFLQLYEAHAQYRQHGLELRGLFVFSDLGDADELSADPEIDQTIGEQMLGYYLEVAYDVLPLVIPGTTHYLAPWFRYEAVDTQHDVPSGFERDRRQDTKFYEVGLDYKPIPEVVFKLDYRFADSDGANLPDDLRVGAGFVF